MKIFFYLVFCFFLILPGSIQARESALAKRVVIVVNGRDPDSRRIGEHYAERRGIPRENIIVLDAPVAETINRRQFIDQLRNPLQEKLFEGGWLLGLPSRLTDEEGRFRSVVDGHRTAFLVLCRGIPLRIEHDPDGVTPEMERTVQKPFLTNAASVDSELALLTTLLPAIGFWGNPLYEKKNPAAPDLARVLKVSRLDGPTPADAMALVDRAIEGERLGLRGRAYLDLAGPHADGTAWLKTTASQIGSLGFDVDEHEGKGTFPLSVRFDAPALYFGWYANNINGPFLLEGFHFPAGAIAFHIHSFSARTLRKDTAGWVGPFVARGAAATLGNVYEPYLQFSHRPDLFFEWVKDGGNIGDAAAYAISAYSWQGVLVGDPLYRPFARPLEKQLAETDGSGKDGLGAYVLIRHMNIEIAEGRREGAIREGVAALKRQPHPALALAVARAQLEEGDHRGAIASLGAIRGMRSFAPMEIMVVREAAELLGTLDEPRAALDVYETLLGQKDLAPELKDALLRGAIPWAERLSRTRLVRAWRAERDLLKAPAN